MTPMSLVLDSSVLVAATLQHEAGHREADALMRNLDLQQVQVVVPTLIIPEVMSALQRNKYPLPRIRQLIRAYQSPRLIMVPLDLQLANEAGEIAILHAVKCADSVFLALARVLAMPLITLDREQQDRAPADIEVFTPEQALAKWDLH